MIKTTLKIEGMQCGMCESHMNDAIRKNFEVKKVTSSHSKNETVILSEEELNEDKIKAVVGETGYDLKGIDHEEYKKKGLFSFFK